MNRPLFITPRVEAMLLKAAITASAAFTLFLGGCEMPRNETLTLGDGPHTYYGGSGATTSEAVFDGPESSAVYAMYGGRESFPEYARLDGRMNIVGEPAAQMATAQWPQPPVPDATSIYYTYLPITTNSSSQVIPVYQRGRQHWRGWRQ